jgi:electron transfer flavoprotein alpha subunit
MPRDVVDAKGVWVYMEHHDGEFENVSLEMLGKARELADELREELVALILGKEVGKLAKEAIARGADRVIAAEHALLADYNTDAFTKVAAELILERMPSIFLLGATHNGRDLAGRLAVRCDTGLTADVTRLEIEEDTGHLLSAVPGFGGSILAIIKCETSRPQMSTVRPGIFQALEPDPTRKGEVEKAPVTLTKKDLRARLVERAVGAGEDITGAERMVVAGRGAAGDMTPITELQNVIGAALGVTRPLADEGLASRDHQIGSTGVTVKPKLAIVAGVSGAAQFTSGIKDADVVIAINNDPEAPIFQYADYCIVDDLYKVLPPLLEALKARGVAS